MTKYLGYFEITHTDAKGRVFVAPTMAMLDAAIEASEMMDALNMLAEVNA